MSAEHRAHRRPARRPRSIEAPTRPGRLRGRARVAQPVAARLAEVQEAPPRADRARDPDRVPDRRRRHRPVPAAVRVQPTSPSPTSIVYAGRPPSLAAPVRRDRRPPARRADAGRQRRPDSSLLIGFSSMFIGVILGTIVGAIAGYLGGFADNVLMRIVDVMLSLPLLFVILVAREFFGRRQRWPDHHHLRAASLDGRQPPRPQPVPVDPGTGVRRGGASAVGVRDRRIIFRHILPERRSARSSSWPR